jgi:hypothetical protein
MSYCPFCGNQIPQADARFCPKCGRALNAASTTPPRSASTSPPPSFFDHPGIGGNSPTEQKVDPRKNFDVKTILFPSETVAWEVDSKEGLIHRHINKAYLITNERVIALDMQAHRVMISLPIRDTDLVVMDRRSSSTSVGSGVYHQGAGSIVRSGSSKNVGTLVFLTNGVERIRLGGIGDPEGVKNIFSMIKRETS